MRFYSREETQNNKKFYTIEDEYGVLVARNKTLCPDDEGRDLCVGDPDLVLNICCSMRGVQGANIRCDNTGTYLIVYTCYDPNEEWPITKPFWEESKLLYDI